MKILVPVDFSPSSQRAVACAEKMAAALEGDVVLMHILEPVGGDVAFVADYQQMISEATKNLEGVREEMTDFSHQNVETLVEVGFPVERIINKIKSDNISLVIMGMEDDMSMLDRDIFGSNAYDIIKKGECPVLTVPAQAKAINLKRIMLAVELKEKENIFMLSFIKSIIKYFKSELYVVHVTPDSDVDLTKMDTESILWLKENLAEVRHRFITLHSKDVSDALNFFSEENEMGLVVLSPEKVGYFRRLIQGSTTRKTVLHTTVPVLTFPIDY